MTLAGLFSRDELGDAEVTGITADSRAVQPGMVFAALAGARADGSAFVGDAVARGAVGVIAADAFAWPDGVPPIPVIRDAEPRRALARAAARLAGTMPRCVIAVTGTNGKTSTVNFLTQIFRANGMAAASVGTLGIDAPGFPAGPSLTTPDPVTLAGTLAAMARAGIVHVAIEASSHGLAQYRLDGLSPRLVAFTNLTRDHLDYHGTMDAYGAAKLRLFTEIAASGATAVINADAAFAGEVRGSCEARGLRVRTVGVAGDDVRVSSAEPGATGTALTVRAYGAMMEIALPLIGRFQSDNALLAAALAHEAGADGFAHVHSLRGARGRIEHVVTLANGAVVYVDYAHTPDAIARALDALRPHARGGLAIVFGAGGDRDPGKRAPMGCAAAVADRVYVTDDNPRTEHPAAIRAAVRAGCPGAIEIGDRRAAIAHALSDLRAGEILVVAGKGHEGGQIIGEKTLPFDDADVIRELAGS